MTAVLGLGNDPTKITVGFFGDTHPAWTLGFHVYMKNAAGKWDLVHHRVDLIGKNQVQLLIAGLDDGDGIMRFRVVPRLEVSKEKNVAALPQSDGIKKSLIVQLGNNVPMYLANEFIDFTDENVTVASLKRIASKGGVEVTPDFVVHDAQRMRGKLRVATDQHELTLWCSNDMPPCYISRAYVKGMQAHITELVKKLKTHEPVVKATLASQEETLGKLKETIDSMSGLFPYENAIQMDGSSASISLSSCVWGHEKCGMDESQRCPEAFSKLRSLLTGLERITSETKRYYNVVANCQEHVPTAELSSSYFEQLSRQIDEYKATLQAIDKLKGSNELFCGIAQFIEKFVTASNDGLLTPEFLTSFENDLSKSKLANEEAFKAFRDAFRTVVRIAMALQTIATQILRSALDAEFQAVKEALPSEFQDPKHALKLIQLLQHAYSERDHSSVERRFVAVVPKKISLGKRPCPEPSDDDKPDLSPGFCDYDEEEPFYRSADAIGAFSTAAACPCFADTVGQDPNRFALALLHMCPLRDDSEEPVYRSVGARGAFGQAVEGLGEAMHTKAAPDMRDRLTKVQILTSLKTLLKQGSEGSVSECIICDEKANTKVSRCYCDLAFCKHHADLDCQYRGRVCPTCRMEGTEEDVEIFESDSLSS